MNAPMALRLVDSTEPPLDEDAELFAAEAQPLSAA